MTSHFTNNDFTLYLLTCKTDNFISTLKFFTFEMKYTEKRRIGKQKLKSSKTLVLEVYNIKKKIWINEVPPLIRLEREVVPSWSLNHLHCEAKAPPNNLYLCFFFYMFLIVLRDPNLSSESSALRNLVTTRRPCHCRSSILFLIYNSR